MRTKWFWPPGGRLQKSPSRAHYFKKWWAHLFGHQLPDGIVRCTNLMVKTRNTWRSTCNLSDLTNRKNSLCKLMDILPSEGVECANSILPLAGECFICQLHSTKSVSDWKCHLLKVRWEWLTGMWAVLCFCSNAGFERKSRQQVNEAGSWAISQVCWVYLEAGGAEGYWVTEVFLIHTAVHLFSVSLSPMQKQLKQQKQRWDHAEALRWPQGFFSTWQIRFPLLECSTSIQPRLVFNPFCLTWKGTSIDCFDPFNWPPCLPALQGGQHQEGSVQPSFKSTPEGCKKLLLVPLS